MSATDRIEIDGNMILDAYAQMKTQTPDDGLPSVDELKEIIGSGGLADETIAFLCIRAGLSIDAHIQRTRDKDKYDAAAIDRSATCLGTILRLIGWRAADIKSGTKIEQCWVDEEVKEGE